MFTKTQLATIVTLILIQIFSSIYYSQAVVKLNQAYNQLEKNINYLNSQNQKLTQALSRATSFSQLNQQLNSFLPINQNLNLQP